jgi:4-amino-4-deoxy-L-arabinose transferase-like glycosyltransferase
METQSSLPQTPAAVPAGKNWARLSVPILLLVFVILCVTSASQKSATYDETHYLGAGNYLLKTHRWDLPDSLLHPVFWTVWHDLPLLMVSCPKNIWTELDGTVRGQKIIALRPDDALLNACRFTLLPFAVALGLIVFRWSQQLYGDAGGLVSLVFFCFCPNLLAHAPLITPDLTLSCFAVLTVWRLWSLAKNPGRRNLLYAGLALGLMLLSKHTALLLLPIFFATDFAYRAAAGRINRRSGRSLWRELRHWLALLGMGFLLVWTAYGFEVGGFALPSGRWLIMPAAPYFQGAFFQFLQSRSEHSFFLMGMHSSTGWWYYFLVVCLIKIPVAILILLTGLVAARRKLGVPWRPDELYLVAPFVLMFVYLSFFNAIQNGFRYLLPVYPLLFIWLGNYGALLRRGVWARVAVGCLVAWTIVGSLRTWPDYLAYFNEFAGSPRNGYHWLGDSNLDWGQDLKELKRFMVRRGIDRIQLSYFGTADPAHYGINYEYLPSTKNSLRPSPPLREGETPSRFVALSASQYQGIAFPDKDFYRFYYQYEPNELIGNSILIFDLKALTPRIRSPLPLRVRQLVGLATNATPVDSCP